MTKRGGAKNTLPLNRNLVTELPNWDTFFVQAHGNLENRLMIVPPNTYILNLATAGKSCSKIKWKIDNLIYEAPDTLATGRRSVVKERLYAGIKAKTILRDMTNAGLPVESIYRPGDTASNVAEQYTDAEAGGFAEKTLAFYEPGDIMFDTKLTFHNNLFPIVVLGAYEVPLPHALRRTVFDINRDFYKANANVRALNADDLLKDFPRRAAAPEHDTMFNIPENILRTLMFPDGGEMRQEFYLSEVLTAINDLYPNGHNHFFMVSACRSAGNKDESRRMRRFSIAARGNRVRTAASAAEIAANPAKQFRTKLTATLLRNLRTQFGNGIAGIPAKKRQLREKAAVDSAAIDANESFNKDKKSDEKYKITMKLGFDLQKKDAELETLREHIATIDRILGPPTTTFNMDEVTAIIQSASGILQPEFKALFGIR